MSQTLKPCPFCLSKPSIETGKLYHCQLHGEPSQAIVIRCKNNSCFARPSIQAGDIYNGGKNKAQLQAIKKWNTRPIEDELTAQRDALLEAAKNVLNVLKTIHCVIGLRTTHLERIEKLNAAIALAEKGKP